MNVLLVLCHSEDVCRIFVKMKSIGWIGVEQISRMRKTDESLSCDCFSTYEITARCTQIKRDSCKWWQSQNERRNQKSETIRKNNNKNSKTLSHEEKNDFDASCVGDISCMCVHCMYLYLYTEYNTYNLSSISWNASTQIHMRQFWDDILAFYKVDITKSPQKSDMCVLRGTYLFIHTNRYKWTKKITGIFWCLHVRLCVCVHVCILVSVLFVQCMHVFEYKLRLMCHFFHHDSFFPHF